LERRGARGRVLCVDDEPNMLVLLAITLGKRFEIVTAESGADGLRALVEHEPFDVVISDLRMPGMNGTEFLAEARAVAPEVVRILLTGEISPASSSAIVREGKVFRSLTKPFPLPELVKVVEEAVERSRLPADSPPVEARRFVPTR